MSISGSTQSNTEQSLEIFWVVEKKGGTGREVSQTRGLRSAHLQKRLQRQLTNDYESNVFPR